MNGIEEAFIAACRDEIEAPKPGNVHIYSDGHGMTVEDFLLSAEAAAAPLSRPNATVGERILSAVEATWSAVGKNTNLGIVLLCAPLAAAADKGGDLRAAIRDVLSNLTEADAEKAFAAILRASPAGLGRSEHHDVRGPVRATLLEAMREAAGRDRIAFQYAEAFIDIFDIGLKVVDAAWRADWPAPWPTVAVYLEFLASFPDSHIARKHGADLADLVRDEAVEVRRGFAASKNPADSLPSLSAFDRRLKACGLNPGTTADLTVATIFAQRLTRYLDQAAQ